MADIPLPPDRVETSYVSRDASIAVKWALGLFFVLQIVLCTYSLFVFWPPAIQLASQNPTVENTPSAAAPGAGHVTIAVNYLGMHWHPDSEEVFLALVISAGALGSALAATTSFGDYVGNRRLRTSWIAWYILRFPIGIGLPLVGYFAVRGGLLNVNANGSDLNPYAIVALAGLAGMFSKQLMDKLNEWANSRFATEMTSDEAIDTLFSTPRPPESKPNTANDQSTDTE
jgi:hypothetical protein